MPPYNIATRRYDARQPAPMLDAQKRKILDLMRRMGYLPQPSGPESTITVPEGASPGGPSIYRTYEEPAKGTPERELYRLLSFGARGVEIPRPWQMHNADGSPVDYAALLRLKGELERRRRTTLPRPDVYQYR